MRTEEEEGRNEEECGRREEGKRSEKERSEKCGNGNERNVRMNERIGGERMKSERANDGVDHVSSSLSLIIGKAHPWYQWYPW